jgi:hypothetical protein
MAFTDKMDSVFDGMSDAELDFDVMFDEDDALVDLVEGFTEDGKPLTGDEFEDVHLGDDEGGSDSIDADCDPDDIRDALGGKDDKFGAKNVEDGSEQKIGDNTKDVDIHDKEGEDQKFFNNSDEEYQKEAAAFLENDKLDIEEEDDTESRKDNNEEYEGIGDVKEASAFLESEEEDLADDDDVADTIDLESKDHAPDLSMLGEGDDENYEDATIVEPQQKTECGDTDNDLVDAMKEASAFLEDAEDGMLADDQEAEAHKEVQCDGSAHCQCPACKASRVDDESFELAVGDTFKESGDAASDEVDSVDNDIEYTEDKKDEGSASGLEYDPSDEDLIDIALNGED